MDHDLFSVSSCGVLAPSGVSEAVMFDEPGPVGTRSVRFHSTRFGVFAGLAAGVLLSGQAGCLRPSPPKLNLEKPAPAASTMDLAPYIRAARFGEWEYERTELDESADTKPTHYARRVTAERLSEGILMSRSLPALEHYLRKNTVTASQPAVVESEAEPPPLPAKDSPQLFELEEPLEPIPLQLAHINPIISSTTLRFYNRRGRLEAAGTMTRRAEVEGLQDVEVPAGRFADCLRVRVQLDIHFSIGLKIDWASYIWLSREAGEVRRIEELAGSFWIFGFGAAHELRLLSYDPRAVQSQPTSATAEDGMVAVSPKWKRGLITLSRGIPRPRISGAIFDFDEPATPPPSTGD